MSIFDKAKLVLPSRPGRRYGIFSGTNSLFDVLRALSHACIRGFSDRDTITDYEKKFARVAGAQYAISFGAGRMALYAILKALEFKPGDEILLPAFTCVVVPNALIYAGLKPVYVDIEPVAFNLEPSQIEALITPKTRAIYLQHTFGVTCHVNAILEIARRHGLKVIEDAAHSLGASAEGRLSGSMGDIAFFSTDHSKVIGTLLGGMVTTSDPLLAERVRNIQLASGQLSNMRSAQMLATFAFECLMFRPWILWLGRSFHIVLSRLGLLFYWRDELCDKLPTQYPYPCSLTSPFARVGVEELKRFDQNLAHRREIAKVCERKLKQYGMNESQIAQQSWLRYSFLVKDRNKFIQKYSRWFDLGIWFTSVVHGRNQDFEKVGYRIGSCPTAEWVAQHIVNYPTHRMIPVDFIRSLLESDEQWILKELQSSEKLESPA